MAVREFIIEGQPVPKARPRVYKDHAVTPKKTVIAEATVREAYVKDYFGYEPFEGDVTLMCRFYLQDNRRVDVDNLLKLVQDALNGVAFKDDSQITRVVANKITPSRMVIGAKGMPRKRHSDDPLTSSMDGEPYDPHTHVVVICDDADK
ncbi:RusA family crossover junction endodeoxyribonuclease [Alloscardovia omnicolens]|uniref:RusA family crossover junction endodeoxyribonuclease n=1 Tax=Alloscardovia omnicolens TaxID=419015 RepID=UPI000665A605|nr:RusA family crossover junction endodeoxyribonuclease [Alloscardovia omnicolens]